MWTCVEVQRRTAGLAAAHQTGLEATTSERRYQQAQALSMAHKIKAGLTVEMPNKKSPASLRGQF